MKMIKRTREKYLRDIRARVGRSIKMENLHCRKDTELLIKYVVSFLPLKKIEYCEKLVAFHEHGKIKGRDESNAVCVNMKVKEPEYFICLDSKFHRLNHKLRLGYIAHELGHVFGGSNPDKQPKVNEAAANKFLEKYYLDNQDFKFKV